MFQGERIYFQGRLLLELFSLPSEKGCTLKGKNLLPRGANSFLLEYTPLQKLGRKFFPFREHPFSGGVSCSGKQTGSHTHCLPCKQIYQVYPVPLTFIWAYSADDKVMIFLLFFSEKQVFTFHANRLIADNLQELSKPVSGKNKKKIKLSSAEKFTKHANL